jgi:Ca2+-transporting ATPase
VGDPTEGALVVAAAKGGEIKEKLEELSPRLAEIPFESEKQYMATLHTVDGDKKYAYVKGSVEKLLSMSGYFVRTDGVNPISLDDRQKILDVNNRMARDALRVIATAYAELPEDKNDLEEKDIDGKLVLLGLSGMADPPREEARKAITDCKKAGIRVIMITGDNTTTAESIARQLNLPEGRAVTGQELKQMSMRIAAEVRISRVCPDEPLISSGSLKALKAKEW